MLRSLVGSEMCIRDRPDAWLADNVGPLRFAGADDGRFRRVLGSSQATGAESRPLGTGLPRESSPRYTWPSEPVSYTHLTLPTKRIVEISVGAVSFKKKTEKQE
eukprot:TRINITY_DN18758_c0_g2_i6.p1 TRINITY_DN18758_c0_g2~~TRINITY_DN18758_c0_g2_i6.p1  ORF type:complete len:119 (+),score=36.73 TRINITY_DN18758_c0_g2_i6:46-357(+)